MSHNTPSYLAQDPKGPVLQHVDVEVVDGDQYSLGVEAEPDGVPLSSEAGGLLGIGAILEEIKEARDGAIAGGAILSVRPGAEGVIKNHCNGFA